MSGEKNRSRQKMTYDEEVEALAKIVHNAWWDEKTRQGFQHPNMKPYEQLTEEEKELDRVTVKTVLEALATLKKVEK